MKWTKERVKNSTGPGEDALLLDKNLAHMRLQAWWDRKDGWAWQLMADGGEEISHLVCLPGMLRSRTFPAAAEIRQAQEAAAKEAVRFLHRQIEELL